VVHAGSRNACGSAGLSDDCGHDVAHPERGYCSSPLVVNLIGAAERRDFLMHARMGMLKALNRDVERVFDQSRKDPHWGKRKLKRDE
jgi:hypothetical protein